MVNSWVERATSDLLIGADWAMNMEISVLLNSDPTQARSVVKGLKRRLGSKNPKVQFLALTLLETIVKNCGDAVHIHVAEKNILNDMVKLVKKKTDFHVKEKILILIDTWQESFGGPRARYPQFYSVYQDLLRAGAVFPQRPDRPAPVSTTETQNGTDDPTTLRNFDSQQGTLQSEAEFPSLSLTEIQNARGIMDVFTQMLNAIDPQNKEGFRDEVLVDLVEQCQTYKQRVVHLLHTTSDESLLCQGITLNDELQQLLAKYQSLTSGVPIPKEQPKLETNGALVRVDAPLIDTGDDSTQSNGRDAANINGGSLSDLFTVAAPSNINGWATPSTNHNPKVDLLSGDDFSSPKVENSLALIPQEEPRPSSPTPQQNALVLADFYSQSSSTEPSSNLQHAYPIDQAQPSTPEFQQQQTFQSSQPMFTANGNASVTGLAQYEQSVFTNGVSATTAWNGQNAPQGPTHAVYGAQSEESFPLPPWEAQPTPNTPPEAQYPQMPYNQSAPLQLQQPFQDTIQMHTPVYSHQSTGNGQMFPGMYMQPGINGSQPTMKYQPIQTYNPTQSGQMMGMFPQPVPVGHQMASMYPQQQFHSYQMAGNYGQFQQDTELMNQQMYGLSVSNNNNGSYRASGNSQSVAASSSYLPPMKAKPKPEDSLFGDLVDLTKFKPGKTAAI